MILSRRANDDDYLDGFTKWPFMTTHSWGEYPQGTWKLEVIFIFHFFFMIENSLTVFVSNELFNKLKKNLKLYSFQGSFQFTSVTFRLAK